MHSFSCACCESQTAPDHSALLERREDMKDDTQPCTTTPSGGSGGRNDAAVATGAAANRTAQDASLARQLAAAIVAIAHVITPLCLSFFFEFGRAVFKPTQASLNAATFGTSGEYFFPTLATATNYGLQVLTTPFWTRLAQRDARGRWLAICASIVASALPSITVFAIVAAGLTASHVQYKGGHA